MMATARTTRNHALAALALAALAVAGLGRESRAAQAKPQVPASTPAPSLDQILREVASFDGGIDSAAMWKLRDYVYAHKDDPASRAECERKLLQFIKSQATPMARMAACRYLRMIGSDAVVPALQAMLSDDRTADMALYVLQQIPGAGAEKALVQSLGATTGATRNAVIRALGDRNVAAAVPALEPLLTQQASSTAAATALAGIGGDAARTALVAAYRAASGDFKIVLARSILLCAEKELAANHASVALGLYEPLASDLSLPATVRLAATMGRIASAGPAAPSLVMELLGGADAVLRQAAIARLVDAIGPDAIGPVCALLPRLPEAAQVQLLSVLASYPSERVLPAVREAARNDASPVRLAALHALETLGGPAEVSFLAEAASVARGPEQAAARAALGALRGRGVDEQISLILNKPPNDGVAGELMLAAADRRMYAAKPIVAGALASTSPGLRMQALKSLRTIGTPSDISAVADLLLESDDEMERAEAEKTIVALGQMTASPDGPSDTIVGRLAGAKTPEDRARLIKLLPQIGDSRALPALRRALVDGDADVRDAAVRAFAAWPTSAARDDVFQLARDSRNETHRLLAIQAFVRSVTLDRFRDPEAAVADLRMAAGFSWRPEEHKLVLGALAKFPCQNALDLANGYLTEPTVAEEAQAAVKTITENLPKEAIRK